MPILQFWSSTDLTLLQFLHEGDDTGEQYCNVDGTPRTYDVAGVLGPGSSSSAIFVSRLLALQQIASFSTWATSDELSDKDRFPYFMRVVPPDRFQVCNVFILRISRDLYLYLRY